MTKELFEYMVCNHRCVSTLPSSTCGEPGYWLCHRVVSVCMFRFVEYGEYKGHLYGTSTDAIEEVLRRGQMCIIDVEPHVSFTSEPTRVWFIISFMGKQSTESGPPAVAVRCSDSREVLLLFH